MLIRSHNELYRPHARLDRRGLLIVTRRLIIATGIFAQCWA
jgi:hypothetical protein